MAYFVQNLLPFHNEKGAAQAFGMKLCFYFETKFTVFSTLVTTLWQRNKFHI